MALNKKITMKDCEKWKKNPTINPLTDRKILKTAQTYKNIQKLCSELEKSKSIEKDKEKEKEKDKEKETFEYKIPEYKEVKSIKDFEEQVKRECPKDTFTKAIYQHFLSKYMSINSSHNSLLLYHSVGLGKTCSAVSIAEVFLKPHNMFDGPDVFVILPASLKTNFNETIFNDVKNIKQCTSDTYHALSHHGSKDVKQIIKKRYNIYSYDEFANYYERNENIDISNKLIIVDEVHNIRRNANKNKRVYDALNGVLSKGNNNKLVLMTATPMYNTTVELLDIFKLILINEKESGTKMTELRKSSFQLNDKTKELLATLSAKYVSYIDSNNPYSFAFKIRPDGLITNKNWAKQIKYGVYPSNIGSLQKIQNDNFDDENIEEDEDEKNNFSVGLMTMNVVFPTNFDSVFMKHNTQPMTLTYNENYQNYLYPDEEHLGRCATKLYTICEKVKKSKGIVLIYSRFLWKGIIPMAIALEHMGMTRSGVKHSFLKKGAKVSNELQGKKYAILTTPDKDITGNNSESFDKLISRINSPSNINGDNIKIVLITQKASEGISFFNIREVHIIDPWYHINRFEQIIGRAIRKCSHINLPIEERNVMIFLHCVINDKKKKTYDELAYEIVSKKIQATIEINQIIKENAIDCKLNEYINHFPKKQFVSMGKIAMKTSQGTVEEILFGENDVSHVCSNKHITELEISDELIETLVSIVTHNIETKKQRWTSLEELYKIINVYVKIPQNILEMVISKCVFPNKIIKGYMLYLHDKGIYLIQDEIPKIHSIEIIEHKQDNEKTVNKSIQTFEKTIEKLNEETNSKQMILDFYFLVSSSNFEVIIQYIISNQKKLANLCYYLWLAGVLIRSDEMNKGGNDFIGYINIFAKCFDGFVLTGNEYQILLPDQIEKLKEKRIFVNKPENEGYGLIIPNNSKNSKAGKDVFVNEFKVFRKQEGKGKKTGILCKNMLERNIREEFIKKQTTASKNKTKLCDNLLQDYYENDKLYFLPEYKPKKK